QGTKCAPPTGNVAVNFHANGRYYFKASGNANAWTGNGGLTTINAPADIYVDGGFKTVSQGSLLIKNATATKVVRLFINGNVDIKGGTIINNGPASGIYISVTKAGTVSINGTPSVNAHLNAPLSDVTITGASTFTR